MKKTICFEIDTSDDGVHCGNCGYLDTKNDEDKVRMWWYCGFFHTFLNTLAFDKGHVTNAPGRHKECIKKCK